MGLFLDSFELPEQELASINQVAGVSLGLTDCILLLRKVMVNGMINGKPVNCVDVLDQLETHGASNSSVHEEFVETDAAECVAAVD